MGWLGARTPTVASVCDDCLSTGLSPFLSAPYTHQLSRPAPICARPARQSMWVGLLCVSVLTPHNPPVLRARVTPAASLVTMRSAQEWRSHIPNYLTFARVGAVPVLIATFYVEQSAAARVPAVLFGAIALTDWLDGYLARRWKVQSELGAFLDPVADKFLVCTALVLLSGALP